jgi:hypothetical protein
MERVERETANMVDWSNNNGDKCLTMDSRRRLEFCLAPQVPDLDYSSPLLHPQIIALGFGLWRDDRMSFAVGWVAVVKR